MSVYFFDTSALVKRYAAEVGSDWVIRVTHPHSGNSIYIAAITGVEVAGALAKKVRQRALSASDASTALSEFRHDFANQYRLFRITDGLISRAMELPQKHKLRAYDAVQLAAALIIGAQSSQQGIPGTGVPPIVLVACDDDLLNAARAEGVAVDDPRDHP